MFPFPQMTNGVLCPGDKPQAPVAVFKSQLLERLDHSLPGTLCGPSQKTTFFSLLTLTQQQKSGKGSLPPPASPSKLQTFLGPHSYSSLFAAQNDHILKTVRQLVPIRLQDDSLRAGSVPV